MRGRILWIGMFTAFREKRSGRRITLPGRGAHRSIWVSLREIWSIGTIDLTRFDPFSL